MTSPLPIDDEEPNLSHIAAGDMVRLLYLVATRLNNDECFETAKPLYEAAFATSLRLHGLDDERTHDCLNALAVCESNRGAYDLALAHYRRLQRSTRRVYGVRDPLHLITLENVRRCRAFVRAKRPTNIAEIVFRSHFTNELEYAKFKVAHDVRVAAGDRLDPEGSAVLVGKPAACYPMTVEHMPGGVECSISGRVWTVQVIWDCSYGVQRVEQRCVDGSTDVTYRG